MSPTKYEIAWLGLWSPTPISPIAACVRLGTGAPAASEPHFSGTTAFRTWCRSILEYNQILGFCGLIWACWWTFRSWVMKLSKVRIEHWEITTDPLTDRNVYANPQGEKRGRWRYYSRRMALCAHTQIGIPNFATSASSAHTQIQTPNFASLQQRREREREAYTQRASSAVPEP
jgi:hypothetical protein